MVALVELFTVNLFHEEDEVRPVDLLGGKSYFGVTGEPCRVYFDGWVVSEDVLCSRAAEFVL